MQTVTIKNFNSTDRPVGMKCGDAAQAQFIFQSLSDGEFTEKVEIELLDEHGKLLDSKVVNNG